MDEDQLCEFEAMAYKALFGESDLSVKFIAKLCLGGIIYELIQEVRFLKEHIKGQPPSTESGGLEGKSANSEPRGKAVD